MIKTDRIYLCQVLFARKFQNIVAIKKEETRAQTSRNIPLLSIASLYSRVTLLASITRSVLLIWHYPHFSFSFSVIWTARVLIVLPTPPCLFPRTFWKWAIMAVVPISAKVEGQPSARCTLYARRRYGRGDRQRLEIALKREQTRT